MIVVVGSVNIDIFVQIGRLPKLGETLLGSDYTLHPGGKGGNQATAAARAGAQVRLVGKAGIDEFADTLLDSLAASGVDIHAVQRAARPSGVAFINRFPDGQNSIIVSPGANSDLSPADLDPAWFAGARVVSLQMEIPLATVLEAARLGREAGALTVLNLSPASRLNAEQLRDVDLLLVNETEASVQLDDDSLAPEAAVRALTELVPMAVMTLGSRGAVWADRSASGSVPAHKVKLVDTTGAGDAFAGALAVSLSEGNSLADAVRFGVAAGGVAVTREGAQPSMPQLEEIQDLLGTT